MIIIKRLVDFVILFVFAAVFASPDAQAYSGCLSSFNTKYPDSQTEDLGGCTTCHQSSSNLNLNVYGADVRSNLPQTGWNGSCPAEALAIALIAVEGLDSDGEGNTNLVEITASTQPGWCVPSANANCATSPLPASVQLDPAPAPPANAVPTAVAGGPYSGTAGTTLIQFDGSASSDPDVDDTLTFAWDFGDGSSGSGMMPTHTYLTDGTFPVTLVVNDGQADSEPSSTTAIISAPQTNLAPTANPGGPYDGEPGQPITFDGSASSDPNTGDTLTYAWNFGDGATGSGVAPTHTYSADATYTVSLTVSDGQAPSLQASTTASIVTPPANRAPTADAGGPYNGNTGVAVIFDGSASLDPDDNTLSYRWDFGDGTTGTGVAPSHIYGAPGAYTVSLTVSDAEFDSAIATATVAISDPVAGTDGAALYEANCLGCHGDPWGPTDDASLPGVRRVAGARACNISGSIFGTSVFPNGVPEMQFLQGLTETEIGDLAEYLNSEETSGAQRYVTTCAGCHGPNGAGGRTGEDVHGDDAGEISEAIADESEMHYLACMPDSDIEAIAEFLAGFDDDLDDDGVDDDEDSDDDNDGIDDVDDNDDDNDGVSDDDEHDDGTDPRDDDTDDDGVNDGDERDDDTDPLDSDTDDDGLDDGDERSRSTDPNNKDTDGDGASDGEEVGSLGTNPLVADQAAVANTASKGGGAVNLLFLMLLVAASLVRRARKHVVRV